MDYSFYYYLYNTSIDEPTLTYLQNILIIKENIFKSQILKILNVKIRNVKIVRVYKRRHHFKPNIDLNTA